MACAGCPSRTAPASAVSRSPSGRLDLETRSNMCSNCVPTGRRKSMTTVCWFWSRRNGSARRLDPGIGCRAGESPLEQGERVDQFRRLVDAVAPAVRDFAQYARLHETGEPLVGGLLRAVDELRG